MNLVLDSTIKVSLILSIGMAVAALMRTRSAAVRHSVLAATIFSAAMMPALEIVVPPWPLVSGQPAARNLAPQEAQPSGGTSTETGADAEATVTAVVAANQSRSAAARPLDIVSRLLAPAWIAGVLVSCFILLVGLVRLAWLAARATPVTSGPWTAAAREIAREYGLRRSVSLLQSDHPWLLVTWGLMRPKVILPRQAAEWSPERIRIILHHELAHIRRGDWLVQMAGELLRSAYWFNPLMWAACMRLRQESEQACDDEVLTRGVDGPEYARHLLDVARALKHDAAVSLPAPAIARPSSLERRIRAMLSAGITRNSTTRSARFATGIAMLTMTVAIAAAQVGPATLTGSVVDPTGAPVAGATVVLAHARGDAKHEVKTSDAGRFEFVPLPADDYVMEVRLPGFEKTQESVTLAGRAVRRDVALRLGTLQETITVGGPKVYTLSVTDKMIDGKPTDVKAVVPKVLPAVTVERTSTTKTAPQPQTECRPAAGGGHIRPPRKVKDVRPAYPQALREAGVGGKVELRATVGSDGSVRDVQVIQSVHPELDAAAVDAVRQWKFDETLLNCAPVDVVMNVTVNFVAK
jgi:TonB family protein